MNGRIDVPPDGLAAYCRRWQIVEAALFGSVLRDDFGPQSDVDVLVRFDPRARHTLFDMVRMQAELTALLGRQADIVERVAVERSPNYLRRRDILQSAETIYDVNLQRVWETVRHDIDRLIPQLEALVPREQE